MVPPSAAASVLLISLLFPAIPARALPADYWVHSPRALDAASARQEVKDGDYTMSIVRTYPDSLAGRLLGIAEAVYPPRDLLIGLAAERGDEFGSDTTQGPVWWSQGTGLRRVPYAVTAGAIDHYARLTLHYRDRGFLEPGVRPLFSSEFLYQATIARRGTFHLGAAQYEDVYVALLDLLWTYDDGTFIPLVKARRVVVLTPAGEVLAVDGDGQADEQVFMSSRRGLGRQELRTR